MWVQNLPARIKCWRSLYWIFTSTLIVRWISIVYSEDLANFRIMNPGCFSRISWVEKKESQKAHLVRNQSWIIHLHFIHSVSNFRIVFNFIIAYRYSKPGHWWLIIVFCPHVFNYLIVAHALFHLCPQRFVSSKKKIPAMIAGVLRIRICRIHMFGASGIWIR